MLKKMNTKIESTSILREMKKRNIGPYQLAKALGGDARSSTGNLMKKLTGNRAILREELTVYCELITVMSQRPLTPEDLMFKVEKVRII